MTTAILQDEVQKFEVAAQDFLDGIQKQHPGLKITQQLIDSLVSELRAIGMYRENLPQRAFAAAFHSAVANHSIVLPPVEPVLDDATIERIRAKFPVTIKYQPKELTQKEKSALAGILAQSGRQTVADRRQEDQKRSAEYQTERDRRGTIRLRSEYRDLKSKAETLMSDNPKSHGQNAAARKEALQKLNSDPRFASVRE